uniref:Uncharacterized protein LOC114337613 n=1 Tax=Diabrotica virgifera virgifera TaxID=50390 RepID=A0A6P7GJF5_DIAVI
MISIKHIFTCTMVDGKTVNVLTETKSTQACNVCKATPVNMNNIEDLNKRVCDQDSYKFGLSILHSYLRTYEYLLHIAYKLETQQWQARGNEAKAIVKRRKDNMSTEFYTKMGLVVDQPKQGGGNSNDGNTARKFFKNPDIVAEITGLSKELIERFANILLTLSSCHYIDEEKFRVYCLETAKLAVSSYGWYKMSASVHKILFHGADIIKSLPLPVGQMSEDVLEASQKSYKNLRQFHSRKTSRLNTNADIFNWMLISSDPVITNTRKRPKKEASTYNEVVRSMLRMPVFLASDDIAATEEHDDEGSEIID